MSERRPQGPGAGARPRRPAASGATPRGATRLDGAGPAAPTAVVLATAPAEDGGPAAVLPWEGGTLLGRLLEQLASLGLHDAHVLTRPAWRPALERALAPLGLAVQLHACPSVSADLRLVAEVARAAPGGVVVALGDVVTHREALAGLLADPRVATGILATGGRLGRPFAFRTRSARGRVVGAASAYHHVGRGNAAFLGVLKVAPRDEAALVAVADRLAALTAPPLPPGWEDELHQKADSWRVSLARAELRAAQRAAAEDGDAAAAAALQEPIELTPEEAVLSGEREAELRRRLAVAPEDAASLLLVGLVREGVQLANSYLRELFWARPLSLEDTREAAERIGDYDEDRVLLKSAVKANDGFFTTFFVSPYSKYIARWAARRGWTPNGVTTLSFAIGLLAAAAFAIGQRPGLIAGAVLLQVAFAFDCVDGQLARYTRTFSKLGAWLDSIFDRGKEYVVFAGLAIGASRAGDPVWTLAGAALTLQTVRHMFDFSFAATQHQAIAATRHLPLEVPGDEPAPAGGAPAALTTTPADARSPAPAGPPAPAPSSLAEAEPDPAGLPRPPLARRLVRELPGRALGLSRALDRPPGARWLKKIVVLPIGERFAAISLSAALAGPRTTFVVLLVWGSLATTYSLAGRALRSVLR